MFFFFESRKRNGVFISVITHLSFADVVIFVDSPDEAGNVVFVHFFHHLNHVSRCCLFFIKQRQFFCHGAYEVFLIPFINTDEETAEKLIDH